MGPDGDNKESGSRGYTKHRDPRGAIKKAGDGAIQKTEIPMGGRNGDNEEMKRGYGDNKGSGSWGYTKDGDPEGGPERRQ